MSVSIVGSPENEMSVRDALRGAESDLILGNDDGLGDRRLERR